MDEAMPRLGEAIEFGPSKIPVGEWITVRTGVAFPTIAPPTPIKAGINFGQTGLLVLDALIRAVVIDERRSGRPQPDILDGAEDDVLVVTAGKDRAA